MAAAQAQSIALRGAVAAVNTNGEEQRAGLEGGARPASIPARAITVCCKRLNPDQVISTFVAPCWSLCVASSCPNVLPRAGEKRHERICVRHIRLSIHHQDRRRTAALCHPHARDDGRLG